ncbi:MAG: serine hydrolase domain-containing protein, partial [Bradymonadaceae bacterium]
MNEPDLAPIHRLLERLYETDKYPAIQICLRHRGEIVFHRAIGEYRPLDAPDTWRPADRDTRFLLFSLSKCVTATAMHILFDRGEICVDDPVHWYVPEFGRAGKEGITLRHLLTHTAGIPMVFWHLDDDLIADWDAVIEEICRQEPVHFPGRYTSYHVFSSGYILAEVLRRVDGRMIDEFLRDELLDPLEMETFDFGIDETFYDRTARVERVEDLPPRPVIAAASRILGVDLEEALAIVNRPVVHDSIIPAGNIIGTAEETSRFFQLLLDGGAYDERRLL